MDRPAGSIISVRTKLPGWGGFFIGMVVTSVNLPGCERPQLLRIFDIVKLEKHFSQFVHSRGLKDMNIRPIKTEADYKTALQEVERLFDCTPNTPEGDRLEILTTLLEAYEETHHRIPKPDPVETILYFIESRGLSRSDLEPYIGSRARVSEVLNRKRLLTISMIRKLHIGLDIPAKILIQPSPFKVTTQA
jgi:HTH-type transcriptional regulator / antitoxin HigA